MVARGCQQFGGVELFRGCAGDGVDDLAGAVRLVLANALDAAERRYVRPFLVEAGGQSGAYGDASRLDTAVAFIDRFGTREVRWIKPLFD